MIYKKAAQEGIVNFCGTLAQINAESCRFLRRGIRVSAAVPNNLSSIQNIEQIRDTGELAQLLTTDS